MTQIPVIESLLKTKPWFNMHPEVVAEKNIEDFIHNCQMQVELKEDSYENAKSLYRPLADIAALNYPRCTFGILSHKPSLDPP